MLTDKYKRELGAYVFGLLNIPANVDAEIIKFGEAIEHMVHHLEYRCKKEKAENKQ